MQNVRRRQRKRTDKIWDEALNEAREMNSACGMHSFASHEDRRSRRRLHSRCGWSGFLVFCITLFGLIQPVEPFSPDAAVHLAVGLSGVLLGLSAPRLGLMMLQSGKGKRKRKGNGFHQCNSCRSDPNLESECDGAMPVCNNCAQIQQDNPRSRRKCGWGKCNCARADCQGTRGGLGTDGRAPTYGTFGSAPAPSASPAPLPFHYFLPPGFVPTQFDPAPAPAPAPAPDGAMTTIANATGGGLELGADSGSFGSAARTLDPTGDLAPAPAPPPSSPEATAAAAIASPADPFSTDRAEPVYGDLLADSRGVPMTVDELASSAPETTADFTGTPLPVIREQREWLRRAVQWCGYTPERVERGETVDEEYGARNAAADARAGSREDAVASDDDDDYVDDNADASGMSRRARRGRTPDLAVPFDSTNTDEFSKGEVYKRLHGTDKIPALMQLLELLCQGSPRKCLQLFEAVFRQPGLVDFDVPTKVAAFDRLAQAVDLLKPPPNSFEYFCSKEAESLPDEMDRNDSSLVGRELLARWRRLTKRGKQEWAQRARDSCPTRHLSAMESEGNRQLYNFALKLIAPAPVTGTDPTSLKRRTARAVGVSYQSRAWIGERVNCLRETVACHPHVPLTFGVWCLVVIVRCGHQPSTFRRILIKCTCSTPGGMRCTRGASGRHIRLTNKFVIISVSDAADVDASCWRVTDDAR